MKRRSLTTAALAAGVLVGTTFVGLVPDPASAGGDPAGPVAGPVVGVANDVVDDEILTRAERALDQTAAGEPATRVDPTLALRDLFLARPGLGGADGLRADDLLGRPTDGRRDPFGDGYSVGSVKQCSKHFCVHYVRSTADAPPAGWARTTLKTMAQVRRLEVGRLGYRPPAKDGRQGGKGGKFDVYLQNLGGRGIFGYCAPERLASGPGRNLASGFCVLDNDFARSQYGRAPRESLRVTAAHEYFHAIQFNYDFREDPWLLESTATWMEERFADLVNDSRRYLRHGQLGRPASSLDFFAPSGLNQYGNWAFWEFLSQRYGNGIVKAVWRRAGDFPGAPDQHSTAALRSALAPRGGLTEVFAAYAGANTVPGRSYPEGSAWPTARALAGATLTAAKPRKSFATRIDHLASKTVVLRPGGSLQGRRWQVRIKVDAPDRRNDPAAYLIVAKRDGDLQRRPIRLNAQGRGSVVVAFDDRTVRRAGVTLANVSTRYRCGRGTNFACAGTARDQNAPFTVVARAFRR